VSVGCTCSRNPCAQSRSGQPGLQAPELTAGALGFAARSDDDVTDLTGCETAEAYLLPVSTDGIRIGGGDAVADRDGSRCASPVIDEVQMQHVEPVHCYEVDETQQVTRTSKRWRSSLLAKASTACLPRWETLPWQETAPRFRAASVSAGVHRQPPVPVR
jgi:hypothetical protein